MYSDFVAHYIAYLALFLVVLIFGVLAPDRFLTWSNLGTVFQNCAVLCVVAIGLTFVIIGGSIDLSVGSSMALAGIFAAWASPQLGVWAFVVAMAVGGVVGAVNGALFVVGRIPSFVVTLGMLSMARGLTVILTQGTPVSVDLASPYNDLGNPPVPLIIMAIAAVVTGLLLKFTTFGRYVFAIGGDEEKTRILGVPNRGVKFAMFVLCGVMAGVGGGILTAQIGSGSPTTGIGFELLAISAVVIGGTPLTGGMGSIVGTVVGSLVMTTLANGLVIVGVSTNVQTVLTGAVLVASVLVSIRRGKIRIIK
ncbi:ABC transporter permease [Paraburkholderia sp. B3]|uniref:ABC transporter permease n=1 Tax=Paraburkholderia sp. B3 TaxID=3134791 RepID=UPI003982C32B